MEQAVQHCRASVHWEQAVQHCRAWRYKYMQRMYVYMWWTHEDCRRTELNMINDQRFNKLFSTASFSNALVRAYLECILGVNCTLHPHLFVSMCTSQILHSFLNNTVLNTSYVNNNTTRSVDEVQNQFTTYTLTCIQAEPT